MYLCMLCHVCMLFMYVYQTLLKNEQVISLNAHFCFAIEKHLHPQVLDVTLSQMYRNLCTPSMFVDL